MQYQLRAISYLCLLAFFTAEAGQFTEIETLFVRTAGTPEYTQKTFTTHNPTTHFTIKLQNGTPGFERISGAQIWLNGIELFRNNDFNQQIEWLEKPIVIQKNNLLKVRLTSKPGAGLKIWIIGIDDSPPTIKFTTPAEDAFLNTKTPTISLSYGDIESGVVLSTLQVFVGDQERSALFVKNDLSATWAVPQDFALSEGEVVCNAQVMDRAGNAGTTQRRFTIDATPPLLAFNVPSANQVLTIANPLIRVGYADVLSGINSQTVAFILNGTDITSQTTVTDDSASFQVMQSLPQGANKLVVSVSDMAGNSKIDSITFQVQTSRLRALPEAYPVSGTAPLSVRFRTKGECAYSTINWYRWDFEGDGIWNTSTQVAQDFSYIYDKTGVYPATLEVTNMLGEKNAAIVRIVVTGPPPKAHAVAVPTNGAAPLTVSFSGWGEKYSGQIVRHEWDLDGDGTFEKAFDIDTSLKSGIYSQNFEARDSQWTPGSTMGATDTWGFGSLLGTPNRVWTTRSSNGDVTSVSKMTMTTPESIAIPVADACTLAFKQTFMTHVRTESGMGSKVLLWSPPGAGTYTSGIQQALEKYVPGCTIEYSNTLDANTIQQQLAEKSALIIPDFFYMFDRLPMGVGTMFKPAIQSFVSQGGVVIYVFPFNNYGADQFINETGLFNISYMGFKNGNHAMQILQPANPLFRNVSNAPGMSGNTIYFSINDDAIALAQYNGYPTIATKEIGSGFAFIFGTDFYYAYNNWAKMLANAVKMTGEMEGTVFAESDDGLDTIYKVKSTAMDSIVKIDMAQFMGRKILLEFSYDGPNGWQRFDRWDLDDISIYTTAGGINDTLLFDPADGNTAWALNNVNGNQWNPIGDSLWGSGWVELVPNTLGNPGNIDAFIESPSFRISGKDVELSFQQRFVSEGGVAGGWIEISQNGGPYQKIAPKGGYPGSLSAPVGGFPANEPVFTGLLGDDLITMNLNPYIGSLAKIRFRFAANNPSARTEWILDDMRIQDAESGITHVVNVYRNPGTYNAIFRVTDNEGKTATASTLATEINVGPQGAPTMFATAAPVSGMAPLGVTFAAGALDSGGQIMLYEWDFDGDGTYDWSSTQTGNTSFTYTKGGYYTAITRVTDNDGVTCVKRIGISVDVAASVTIFEFDRTFNPFNSEIIRILTTLSGGVPVMLYLKDNTGQIVRTIVDRQDRAGGTYIDIWDGRDDTGNLLKEGAYYAVLEYKIGEEIRSVDLTYTTGGQASSPGRNQNPGFTVQPYGNVHLPIRFTLIRPFEVTLFMGVLWGADIRLRTIIDQVPFGAGTYTFYWDGLTDDFRIPSEHSGNIIAGTWGIQLAENAIWVQANRPSITSLSTSPSKFAPMSEICTQTGDKTGITINFSVDIPAPAVRMKLFSIENGQQILEKTWNNISAGSHTYFWNGRDEENRALDEGRYRIGLCCIDQYGQESFLRYNLLKTKYSFLTEGE